MFKSILALLLFLSVTLAFNLYPILTNQDLQEVTSWKQKFLENMQCYSCGAQCVFSASCCKGHCASYGG